MKKKIKAEKSLKKEIVVEEQKMEETKNIPKKKRKIVKEKDKRLVTLKYITFILAGILLIEGIYCGIKMYTIRKNTTYYSAINNVIETKSNLVAVGLSDSKNSKYLKYEKPGYNKPYIWIYDKNQNIKNEIRLEAGYNGQFTDIIETTDGYIVIGYLEMTEANHKDGNTEGTIIKYDKNFKVVWRKNLDILGNTRFNAIKEMTDGTYIVVGTSIYPNDVIGNHDNGGAIIVKYDKFGSVLSITNYGGPRTGEFNDVVLLDDGLIVVGVKSGGTGIIFKYDYNGNEVWHNYYGYTDSKGLTSINKLSDNEFIVTGSKLESKDKTDNYQAALLKYDGNGKLINEKLYQKSRITRFQSSLILNNTIYVIGLYGQKVDDTLDNDSVVVSYALDFNLIDEKVYEGGKTYTLNQIIAFKDSYLVAGHTNSKISTLKTNGLDYYPVLTK